MSPSQRRGHAGRAIAAALACGLVAGATLTAPRSADACINSIHLKVDGPIRKVKAAELLVRAGKVSEAYKAARYAYRNIRKQLREYPDSDERSKIDNLKQAQLLRRQSLRIMAIAQVRARGALDFIGRLKKNASKRYRRKKIGWARYILRVQWRKAKTNPVMQARYAEALAQSSKRHRKKALAMLESLAKRDIMPDAWGYRTLAELYHQSGNKQGRDAALAKCRNAAGKQKQNICPTLPDKFA